MNKKRFYISFVMSLMFIAIPLISVGYAALQTTLNISGDFVMLGKPTLYNVFANEARIGRYVFEYAGQHQDSMDGVGTEKIYYWTGFYDNVSIPNRNNVIFGDHCWQMLRTTDTGGVKMVYNGEPENGQCLDTRGNHIGYGTSYVQALSSNYWYGTDYTYDSTNNVFSLSGITEQAIWNDTTAPNLIGKYTCKKTIESGTCSTIYLVESYYSTTKAYIIPLGSNNHYSQIGNLQFNLNDNSPAYVGYMYNVVYPYQTKDMISTEKVLSSYYLDTAYWYADSITWGTPVANRYNLDNPYKVNDATDYPNLVGKYTFRSIVESNTSRNVYYIAEVRNSSMYYIELSGGQYLSDSNYSYTYGDSYIDNGNGTYTIINQDESNPITINRSDWYSNYSNVGLGKYVCKNAINNTCSDLWYILSSTVSEITYIKVTNSYKYSKGFTWDGNKYVLDNDNSTSFWNIRDDTNKASLSNAHYTCWNETGECTTVSYIYYMYGITPYYIDLTGGDSVEDAINYMLRDNEVNSKNSTIKNGIDAWYKHYLLEKYDSYIEDTIFCNNRSINSLGGWDSNGGSISAILKFKEYTSTNDLNCTNETDKFSIYNSNAKLTYKVGMMSSSDMSMNGYGYILRTGQPYWVGSPYEFSYKSAFEKAPNESGFINSASVSHNYGVRPVISLIPGIEYTSGDGSMANPFIVDAQPPTGYLYKQNANASITFGKGIARNSFESVKFLTSKIVPNDAIDSWDASHQQNGSVMAWYTDSDSNGLYELFIGQTGGVNANPDSSYAFSNFTNVSSIDLQYYKTDSVTRTYNMFEKAGYDATSFTILGLSNFNTSNISNMAYMFTNAGYSATSCSLGNLSSWDVSNVETMASMFNYTCKSSSAFDIGDLSNWDTSHVSNMSYMFFHAGEIASTWNIGSIKIYASDTSYMFNQSRNANCTLNIYNNPSNYSTMLSAASVNSGEIIVNYTADVTEIDNIIATKSNNSNVTKGSLIN